MNDITSLPATFFAHQLGRATHAPLLELARLSFETERPVVGDHEAKLHPQMLRLLTKVPESAMPMFVGTSTMPRIFGGLLFRFIL